MTGQFLVYSNYATAMAKAEAEGRVRFPTGWAGETKTKYVSLPGALYTPDGEEPTYALDVSDYTTLTSQETGNIVTEVKYKWEKDAEDGV